MNPGHRLAMVAMVALALPSPAQSQVFSQDRPPPVLAEAMFWHSPGGSLEATTCGGGPGFMMTLASGEGNITAYGDGGTHSVVVRAQDLVEALGGIGEKIQALAISWDQDRYYVGFQPKSYASQSMPIVEVGLHGAISIAVDGAELDAVGGEPLWIWDLVPTEDGLLYARARSKAGYLTDVILRLDPSRPEGDRVEVALDIAELEAAVAPGPGELIYDWGVPFAADSQGRLWLRVLYDDGDILTGATCVLARRDPDGTWHELTPREPYPDGDVLGLGAHHLPCQATRAGMIYDEVLEQLVSMGAGMWLIDPEVPGQVQQLVTADAFAMLIWWLTDGEHYEIGGGLSHPSTCLGFSGAQGIRAYTAKPVVPVRVAILPEELDVDHDFLTRLEEDLLGTDWRNRDSDGDGVLDGLERLDGTDPLDGGNVRAFEPEPEAWSMSARYVGSEFQKTLMQFGTIMRWAALLPDGSIGITTHQGGGAEWYDLIRFTDWDQPAEKLPVESCETVLASDPKGNLYCTWHYVEKAATFNPADGGPVQRLLSPAEEAAFLAPDAHATDVDVRPDGTLFVAWSDGSLLRRDPGEGFREIYDAREDMERAGIVTPESGNWCFLSECQCTASVGPVTWDPVRALLYFWIQPQTKCGTAPAGLAPMLVMQRHDGSLRVVLDQDDLEWATFQFGGLDIKDTEPDMDGGLWILAAGGVERALFHVDENLGVHPVEWFRIASGHAPYGGPEGHIPNRVLAHGDDLVVTPEGRLFFLPWRGWMDAVPTWFPVEIIPIEPAVRAGRFVTVHGGERALGILDPQGAGMALHVGDPLVQPMSVAATDAAIFVGDPGASTVWRFALDEDGRIGDPEAFAEGFEPGGMDVAEDGALLVVDRSAARVVRIDEGGVVEEVLAAGVLAAPRDLVAAAGGAFGVTDGSTGELSVVTADGQRSVVASHPGADAVTLDDGRAWIVASATPGTAPVRLLPDGDGLRGEALMDEPYQYDLTGSVGSGGLATDDEGNIYWMVRIPAGLDAYLPASQLVRALRITRDGYASPLLRGSMGGSEHVADVAPVHLVGESWPTLPGSKEPWPAETADPAPAGDIATAPDPGPAAPPPPGDEGCDPGGCAVGDRPASSATAALLLLILLLPAVRRRLIALAIPVLLLASCASPERCEPAGGGPGDASGGELPGYHPEVIAPECLGKDLCPPGIDPVCDGKATYRICHADPDGCHVWSAAVPCTGGQTCTDGSCAFCTPNCHGLQCGDDGCGGSCGTCEAPDSCCHGSCAPCAADCAGRLCGDDGAGGSCGDCGEGLVCDQGSCVQTGTLDCTGYSACTADCWPWDEACFAHCETAATEDGLQHAAILEGCAIAECFHCYELAGDAAGDCLDLCLVLECPEPLGICGGVGEGASCAELLGCMLACGDDAGCMAECFVMDGAQEAAIGFEVWLECLRGECEVESLPALDDPCVVAAAAGACSEFYGVCVPGD